MNKQIKNRILNIMIVGSVVLLGATGLEVLSQNQAQDDYESLSLQRIEMERASKVENKGHHLIDQDQIISKGSQAAKPGLNTPSSAASTESPATTNSNRVWLDINPDFLGWVNVKGTSIDYPYVRSQDNQDYLKLNFYGRPNKSGTLFMDYRNIGSFKDGHLLIYGHNMKNGTMFHDLVKFHDETFYRTNREITVSDLYGTKRYRIFSVHEISASDYELPLGFKTGEEKSEYIKILAKQSMHGDESDLLTNGRILSLVTCSYGINNGRTIVNAMEISD